MTQHSEMFTVGEKHGTMFSLESMRKEAARRLENQGWTTTIHHHDVNQPCNEKCEDYYDAEVAEAENE